MAMKIAVALMRDLKATLRQRQHAHGSKHRQPAHRKIHHRDRIQHLTAHSRAPARASGKLPRDSIRGLDSFKRHVDTPGAGVTADGVVYSEQRPRPGRATKKVKGAPGLPLKAKLVAHGHHLGTSSHLAGTHSGGGHRRFHIVYLGNKEYFVFDSHKKVASPLLSHVHGHPRRKPIPDPTNHSKRDRHSHRPIHPGRHRAGHHPFHSLTGLDYSSGLVTSVGHPLSATPPVAAPGPTISHFSRSSP